MTPSLQAVEPYTGTINVSIRPNPYTVDSVSGSPWEIDDSTATIVNSTDMSSMSFDNVFAPDKSITNRQVYDSVCHNVVDKFLNEGFNSTVFAYGMTGSGKTFSMRGNEQDPGFVTLAVDAIFNKIGLSGDYSISLTYLEIYNEKIIDLLLPATTPSSLELKIRDDPVYGTKIVGITSPEITSKEQLQQLIKKGDTNRKTSATDFNTRSSRSHSILQIKLAHAGQHATLSLCDLAGSERATSSAERRKEGAFINKSLLALSTVINKLSIASSGSSGSDHIPYRDSKLTRLLQPALSGTSLILILCTIHLGSLNTNAQSVSETANTLRFAARAKDIVMHVQKNKPVAMSEVEYTKVIEQLKRTIETQKNEILALRLAKPSASSGLQGLDDTKLLEQSLHVAQLESENKILNERLEHLNRLVDMQRAETVILKNDTLNDILGSGSDSLHIAMANLENFYRHVQYEMDEQKSYIAHLEAQFKLAHRDNTLVSKPSKESEEKDEEIAQLKELIKDKDHLIKSLTKTTKLRRLVDSNSVNVDGGDKENSFGDLRRFKISPKKATEEEKTELTLNV